MAGVELSLEGGRDVTGARGTAALALPRRSKPVSNQILVGRKDDDVAFLPESTEAWSETAAGAGSGRARS